MMSKAFGEMLVEHSRVEADHFFGGERVQHSAEAVNFARDVFRGAPLRALEHHVLDEMRDAVEFRPARAASPRAARFPPKRNGRAPSAPSGRPGRSAEFPCAQCELYSTCLIPFLHGVAVNVIRACAKALRNILACYDGSNMSSQVPNAGANLLGKSPEELREFLQALGEPAYRGAQIYHALYAERRFDFAAMTNLPAALRERLSREARIALPQVVRRYSSSDGTVRYVLAIGEGDKPRNIETVFMPEENRQTICVSTQAGCAVDCRFCLTAHAGPGAQSDGGRNRGAGARRAGGQPRSAEAADQHRADGPGRAAAELRRGDGRGAHSARSRSAWPFRRSTSRFRPAASFPASSGWRRKKCGPKLAISLNASSDEQRDEIMPINRKYPLEKLLDACRNYPLRPWEYLTFEYVLLGGFNDSPEDARRVVRLLANLRAKVNLIPWNPGDLPYEEPDAERVEEFQSDSDG